MELKKQGAEIFVPDGVDIEKALSRTTIMGISAHQDDLEIMAYHGIEKCFGNSNEWFAGVIVTNGAGSARNGIYKDYTDEEMQQVRKKEQKKAAYAGEYGSLFLLNYKSSEVKEQDDGILIDELAGIIEKAAPDVIYTHNLADKHDTHVSTVLRVLKAVNKIHHSKRPKKVYGCEVWRSLDWMRDEDKTVLDVSGHPNISAALVELFDSQIIGGKRYDLATQGRRLANATYFASHETDEVSALTFAMDLTPLITDSSLDVKDYVLSYIKSFYDDVAGRIEKFK